MKTYFRLISRTSDNIEELTRVVKEIIVLYPGTSLTSSTEVHPKGGFCVYLEHQDGLTESIMAHFSSRGWLTCF